ncbi:hypothetical protein BDC45DRAFT_608072 [Circinella umbellata]|nr:hypothetical protein BDC45DRAFT_608072 [Circinella umbellata]
MTSRILTVILLSPELLKHLAAPSLALPLSKSSDESVLYQSSKTNLKREDIISYYIQGARYKLKYDIENALEDESATKTFSFRSVLRQEINYYCALQVLSNEQECVGGLFDELGHGTKCKNFAEDEKTKEEQEQEQEISPVSKKHAIKMKSYFGQPSFLLAPPTFAKLSAMHPLFLEMLKILNGIATCNLKFGSRLKSRANRE